MHNASPKGESSSLDEPFERFGPVSLRLTGRRLLSYLVRESPSACTRISAFLDALKTEKHAELTVAFSRLADYE